MHVSCILLIGSWKGVKNYGGMGFLEEKLDRVGYRKEVF